MRFRLRRLGSPLAVCLGAFSLLATAVALAHVHAPAIKISVPKTLVSGSKFTVKASGYFNCTKKTEPTGKCANVAYIEAAKGSFRCTRKAYLHTHRGDFTFVAGGPSDKQMRASTPTTPGHFAAKEKATAPSKTGKYTYCGVLLSYPIGHVSRQMATAHAAVTP
jgi:hypothetical protein